MAARIWRGAVIKKKEEDPATCPIGRQAGIWIKADVGWASSVVQLEIRGLDPASPGFLRAM
jgi:hypothetical protein